MPKAEGPGQTKADHRRKRPAPDVRSGPSSVMRECELTRCLACGLLDWSGGLLDRSGRLLRGAAAFLVAARLRGAAATGSGDASGSGCGAGTSMTAGTAASGNSWPSWAGCSSTGVLVDQPAGRRGRGHDRGRHDRDVPVALRAVPRPDRRDCRSRPPVRGVVDIGDACRRAALEHLRQHRFGSCLRGLAVLRRVSLPGSASSVPG